MSNHRGFTLIELLIVVAIIGILAAVGAAVIPGLLEKTKINATRSNHEAIVSFVKTATIQCEMGGEAGTNPPSVRMLTHQGTEHFVHCNSSLRKWITAIRYHFMGSGSGWKNPYNQSVTQVQAVGGTPSTAGQTNISDPKSGGQKSGITITSCIGPIGHNCPVVEMDVIACGPCSP